EHVLEERLSEPAPDLGRLEDLLEASNAPPHVEDALVRLGHLADAAPDAPPPPPPALQLPRDAPPHLPHLRRHLGRELGELLANGGRRLRQPFLSLVARRFHLALEEKHGLVGLAAPRLHVRQLPGHAG